MSPIPLLKFLMILSGRICAHTLGLNYKSEKSSDKMSLEHNVHESAPEVVP